MTDSIPKVENTTAGANHIGVVLFSFVGFVLTFAFFTHFVIFLGNLPKLSEPWVWPSVDVGRTTSLPLAVLLDLALVAIFGLQHSLMARPGFKAWWRQYVPDGLERSVYVLAAVAAGFLLLWLWQPIPLVVWDVSGPLAVVLWTLFGVGWMTLLISAINFDIFELLGQRHALAWVRNQPMPRPSLKKSGLYRVFRHPMYVGVLLGFWATPHMTAGHALLAAALTGYILIAKRYEERDLRQTFAGAYGKPSAGSP